METAGDDDEIPGKERAVSKEWKEQGGTGKRKDGAFVKKRAEL